MSSASPRVSAMISSVVIRTVALPRSSRTARSPPRLALGRLRPHDADGVAIDLEIDLRVRQKAGLSPGSRPGS